MFAEKLVTRSYVMKEDGTGYTLKYYLLSTPQDNFVIYGVAIEKHEGIVIESQAAEMVSKDEEYVLGLIECFASNFVFPIALFEHIHDMQKV